MKVFRLILILLLAAVGSAGEQPAFRADVRACPMVGRCQTAGGPNVSEAAVARNNASAVNRHAEAYVINATGPEGGSAGFWDTVTVTDPTLPMGEPLEVVVVAHVSGSVTVTFGHGRATAGLRTDGTIPDGPLALDGSTYRVADSDIDQRIIGSGYDEILYSEVITISNGDTVAFYSNVTASANHRGGGARVQLDSWIAAVNGNDLVLDWASQQE